MGPVHRKFADLETKRPDRPKPAGLQVVRFRGEARTLLDGPIVSRPANGAYQDVASWTNPTSAVHYLQAASPFAAKAGFTGIIHASRAAWGQSTENLLIWKQKGPTGRNRPGFKL